MALDEAVLEQPDQQQDGGGDQPKPKSWVDSFGEYVSKKPDASDADLYKQFPQLGKDSKKLDAAFSYIHAKGQGMSDQDAQKLYPEFANAPQPLIDPKNKVDVQSQPEPVKPSLIPKIDINEYNKRILQANPIESTVGGSTEIKQGIQQQAADDAYHKKIADKYKPLLDKVLSDIDANKGQFVDGKRPALDYHPDAPDSYYEAPKMSAIDDYLKKNVPDATARYYIRNKIINQFQENKDRYNTDKIAQSRIDQIPAVQQAKQEQLKAGNLNKPEDLSAVLARAAQIDPTVKDQVNQAYQHAAKSNEDIKNETTRAILNNSTSLEYDENGNLKKVNALDVNSPFHDQITGAGKALQGVFKFSGQVGQMASGILSTFGAKETGYNLQKSADDYLQKNAFPGGNQTASEFLSGEALPMVLQGAAMGRLARGLGAPIFKALSGAAAKGLISKAAEGALGGIALAPINSALISHDYYTQLVRSGETPEIAHAKAENVFDKNLVTDMAISPLQFGIMNAPVNNAILKGVLQYVVSPTIAGAHFMAQDYFQQKENNPALTVWKYATSSEGIKTGLTGAITGLVQHYAIGKMNDWQNSKNVKDAFSFGRQDKSAETSGLPNNNVLANTVLNAFEMKDSPKRAGELSGLVDELHEKGVYNDQEATKIKGIIEDVAAVKAQVPKMGTSAQRMAVFNELLNKHGYEKQMGDAQLPAVQKMLEDKSKESDERIVKIMNEEEPLYFINGIETSKDQLQQWAKENPEVAQSKAVKIDIIGDDETKQSLQDAKNKFTEQVAQKPAGEENAPGEELPAESQNNITEVRHAITPEDQRGVTSGPTDVKLNEEGRGQAEKLAESMKGQGVKKVVSSGLPRAAETAQIVADKLGIPHATMPEIRSWDIGEFDQTKDTEFKKAEKYFVTNPDATEFEGKKINESFNQYKDRVIAAREKLHNESGDHTLVVNHGGNIAVWDAYQKNGKQWDSQAEKSYLNSEEIPPAEVRTSIGSKIDKRVNYKGEEGDLFQEGQRLIFDNGKKQYDLGNVKELSGRPLSDIGITEPTERVRPIDKQNIEVAGEQYHNPNEDPTAAIKRNGEGKITSVELETPAGKKRSFGGPLAQEVAYHLILAKHGEAAEEQIAREVSEGVIGDKELLAGLQKELAKLNLSHLLTDEHEPTESTKSKTGPATGDDKAGATKDKLLQPVRKGHEAETGTGKGASKTEPGTTAPGSERTVQPSGGSKGKEDIQGHAPKNVEESDLINDLAQRLGKKALPKLRPESDRKSGGKIVGKNPLKEISEYFKGDRQIQRAVDFLKPILDANPHIKLGEFEPEKYHFNGNPVAYSLPDGTVAINERAFSDKGDMYRTLIHEYIHAATRSEIERSQAFKDELSDVLSDIRKALKVPEHESVITALYNRGAIDENLYGTSNEHELLAEVFSNEKFADYLKGVKYNGDSLLKRVYLAIAKHFSAAYKTLAGAKANISADNMADYLMKLTESVIKRPGAEDGAGALPMIGKASGNPLEDFVREKLDENKEASIKKALITSGGMKDTDAQALIDKVRNERNQSPEDIIRDAIAAGKAAKKQPIANPQQAKEMQTGLRKTLKRWYFDGVDDVSDVKSIIRKNKGNEEFNIDKIFHATRKLVKYWNSVPKVNQMAFMLGVEKPELLAGQPQNIRDIADSYRDRLDKTFQIIHNAMPDLNFVEDYFPHFWKKPDQVRNFMANTLAKAPLEGGKSFAKKRFFETIVSGLKEGYELATTNPEEIVRLAEANAWKFKTARDILGDMDKKGLVQMAPVGEGPAGWQTVKDPAFQNMAMRMKSYKSGDSKMAALYMPPDVAKLMNDYLSIGVKGPVKDFVQQYNNIKNLFQLGVGFFHFGTTTTDALVTGMTNGIQKLSAGNPRGLLDLATFGNLPATVIRGFKARAEWNAGKVTADTQALMDANAKVGRQKMYALDAKYNMMKAFAQVRADGDFKQLPKALWNAMLFLPEAINKPLMEHWVPSLKVGGYLRSLDSEIASRKNMTPEELQNAKQKIWDSMDDRLGQVVYDNIFVKKAAKDLAFLAVRSAGWTGGTLRAVSGGVAELPRSGQRLVRGQGLTQRTAYLTALPLTVGLMGAFYQYLLTGKGPEEMKDYFFPKDGTKSPDGTDHRVDFPSYMKDILSYTKSPVTTLLHKTSPILNDVVEIYQNKDFYSEKIYNGDDPIYQKGLDILKHEAGTMEPFSFKKNPYDESPFIDQVTTRQGIEQKFGIMPAPKERERSDTQNAIMKAMSDQMGHNEDGKTHAEMEQQIARRHLREFIFNGGDWKDASDEWKDKAGLKPQAIQKFVHESKMDPYERYFKALKPETKVKLYQDMNDEDKEKYGKWIPVAFRNQANQPKPEE